MKKFIYLVLLVPTLVLAQKSSQEIHERFENENGVNSFTFSKMMLDAIDMTSESDDGSVHHLTGDLHKVKFLNFNEDASQNSFEKLNSLFINSKYEIVDLDDSEGVAVYIARKGKRISEIHLLLDDVGEGSLVSIYGKLKAEELCTISSALQINACQHLKHIK